MFIVKKIKEDKKLKISLEDQLFLKYDILK